MSQYKIGTASVTNGSATVTGSGTAWLTNATIGDYIVIQDGSLSPAQIVAYIVGGVVSDTELTLTTPYGGPTGSGFPYVAHRGFHPNGSPKFSSIDVEFAAIQNDWNAKTQATTALGTAATADVQTSPTDTTADAVMTVGAFGLGSDALLVSSGNADDYKTKGEKLFFGSSVLNLPNTGSQAALVEVVSGDASGGRAAQTAYEYATKRQYLRVWGGATWSTWQELWHTGNLNQFEFGVIAGSDSVGQGWAIGTTSAVFLLPISLFSPPSSITIDSTFEIRDTAGSILASGLTGASLALSGASSHKVARVSAIGVAGLTAGETLELRSETASSKITVNP